MNIPFYELARIEDECSQAGVLDEYRKMVLAGTSPRAAAMYALQSPAGARNTDRAFCQGQQRKMESMGPLVRGMLQKRAKAAGIDTDGKYYMSGIGGHTDPAAWVSCAEDVLTVAKARNLKLEGSLNRQADPTEQKPPPDVVLAPDLVREFERKAFETDPGLRERCLKNRNARQELRESLVEKHGKKKRVKQGLRIKGVRIAR
jgi:hypothetical protein